LFSPTIKSLIFFFHSIPTLIFDYTKVEEAPHLYGEIMGLGVFMQGFQENS
jgi:hypothetical protein